MTRHGHSVYATLDLQIVETNKMDQKQQIVDSLKKANNILVTVSNNPSVDQLASCIGLTLAFNKAGKHATAVFSGAVPSTIEFLEPEKTIEDNTDSLRDFIISLDKTKADKLRYKVEDTVVKIFITPYRTSINEKDLEFSQGDFNVDVVLALGVHNQADLDQAITSHGRILHDATVATVNVMPGGELGSLNWLVPGASSLSELAVDLIDAMDKKLVDAQIATAFLTGIVAETKRFSNERTSPDTMSISAELMAAGANQQLVATKLEEAAPKPPEPEPQPQPQPQPADQLAQDSYQPGQAEDKKSEDGTLEISHDVKSLESNDNESGEPEKEKEKEPETPQIHIDDKGSLRTLEEIKEQQDKDQKASNTADPSQHVGGSHMILQPPSMGGAMSATGVPDGSMDPLSLPQPSDIAGSDTESPSGAPYAGSPASANITSPDMPFMPASMMPGGGMSPPPGDPFASPSSAPASAPAPMPDPSPMLPPTPSPVSGPVLPPANDSAMSPPPLAPQDLGMPSAPMQPPATTVAPDGSHVDDARSAVMQAINGQASASPGPIQALNAQPLGDLLHSSASEPPDLNVPAPPDPQTAQPAGLTMPAPVGAPPPVPPPMMPSSPQ